MNWKAGGATALVALAVLIAGLMPPHVIATGQFDPIRAWGAPVVVGAVLLSILLRWLAGRWRAGAIGAALLALFLSPLLVAMTGSGAGLAGLLARQPMELPIAAQRPRIGILSGPPLHSVSPADGRGGPGGFEERPLWQALARVTRPVPLDALVADQLAGMEALLIIQPRALAPDELVALDGWVRGGGRAVLLADPHLLWEDERPLGHPARPPATSLLSPLLDHWGVALAPASAGAPGGDPVERRRLAGGRMIQLAGASQFFPTSRRCLVTEGGLVARCRIGRGAAILVADADFANDSLWTTRPDRPLAPRYWTSDAVPQLADWLSPGNGAGAGRRLWLAAADGLGAALRPALLTVFLLSMLVARLMRPTGTKDEKEYRCPTHP